MHPLCIDGIRVLSKVGKVSHTTPYGSLSIRKASDKLGAEDKVFHLYGSRGADHVGLRICGIVQTC